MSRKELAKQKRDFFSYLISSILAFIISWQGTNFILKKEERKVIASSMYPHAKTARESSIKARERLDSLKSHRFASTPPKISECLALISTAYFFRSKEASLSVEELRYYLKHDSSKVRDPEAYLDLKLHNLSPSLERAIRNGLDKETGIIDSKEPATWSPSQQGSKLTLKLKNSWEF